MMKPKPTLEQLFPQKDEAILAESVLNYFKHLTEKFPEQCPISVTDSTIAYFKHDWRELISDKKIPASAVCSYKERVAPEDVEKKLVPILEKLVNGQYLEKNRIGYTAILFGKHLMN